MEIKKIIGNETLLVARTNFMIGGCESMDDSPAVTVIAFDKLVDNKVLIWVSV
jgi:hypothetical protein